LESFKETIENARERSKEIHEAPKLTQVFGNIETLEFDFKCRPCPQ